MTPNELLRQMRRSGAAHAKYVRLSDGSYHFCDIYLDHKSLIRGDEVAVGAGMIRVHQDHIQICGNSMGLQIGPCSEDFEDLPGMFNLPTEV